MNYKTLFLILFSFLLCVPQSFARETIAPDLGAEDLYFYNDVFIQGVSLPENVDVTDGQSSVLLEGTGSLTLINKKVDNQGGLRFTLFGGTEVESRRIWNSTYLKDWWGGVLPSLSVVQMPRIDDIVFTADNTEHSSRNLVYGAYGLGMANEEFSFSQPGMFVFPVAKPDGTKILIASRSLSDDNWSVSGDFCMIEDGYCVVALSQVNEIALVEQLYSQCFNEPQDVQNGEFVGPPTCSIRCNRGYVLSEDLSSCVKSDYIPGAGSQDAYKVRPGTFRFINAREEQIDKKFDLDISLTGNAKDDRRIRIHNAASRETVRDDVLEMTKHQNTLIENEESAKPAYAREDNSGFLNYLLEVRDAFDPSPNVFSEEVALDETEPLTDEFGEPLSPEQNDDFYSSAPLLPSTGAGVFLTLILFGIAVMIFARRRQY